MKTKLKNLFENKYFSLGVVTVATFLSLASLWGGLVWMAYIIAFIFLELQ
jgi:hypothetical protein